MKEMQEKLGLAVIVGGNLIPLYGLFYWGWDVFSLFFLYWAENVVIGIYTLIMMFIVGVRGSLWRLPGMLFMMAFFTVHYGMFCMGHLAILTDLFGGDLGVKVGWIDDLPAFFQNTFIQGFYWGLGGLVIAQAFQSFDSWQKIYSHEKNQPGLMVAPYGRIMVLHLAILIGGLGAAMLQQPAVALAVLVALKTLYDVGVLRMRHGYDATPENS